MTRLIRYSMTLICFSAPIIANAEEPKTPTAQQKTIAIIGNSELPKYDVALPWRVMSDKDPTKIELEPQPMPDALAPTTIEQHRSRIFFERYIQVPAEDMSN